MKITKISILVKAMLLMCLVMIVTATITATVFLGRANEFISTHSFERLEAIQKSFTFNAEYGLLVKDREALNKLCKSVKEQKDIVCAFVLDKDGALSSDLSAMLGHTQAQKLSAEVLRRMQGHQDSRVIFETLLLSGLVNVFVEGIYSEKKHSAEEMELFESDSEGPRELIGYSVIASSPNRIHVELKKVRDEILFTNAAMTALVLAFVFVLVLFLVKALRRLNEAMRKIGQGELAARVFVKSGDELQELAEGFNHMAEDLQKTTVSRDALAKEIEERKRLENMVLQSEKMAAVGQLAGGVAHEINNPLGVILGFSQSLVKRLQPGDPHEMPLKSIEREAVRCKNLVQDLLTFSRTGKTDRDDIDLNEAIESSLSLVLAQTKVKNTVLTKEFSPELPKAYANKNQVQQVIVNLCNNAMDAMGDGGKIILRTKPASRGSKKYVQVEVEDTGGGIPKDIQAKIFEPFFTTKEVGKGTGLGLSLVYEIVQKHEGEISLTSEVGKGTIFTVLLPAHIAPGA